ncbi:hypothetical protein Hamer_G027015 [Homarus americanus]|uniref:Uncharacterized protein n=1 Tax=Homarus americanus TaxID=6706 RepID=A0A8J5JWK3_HOMAM|nr:hypothetical protein Hamer_G027015 [Homarus americanus]
MTVSHYNYNTAHHHGRHCCTEDLLAVDAVLPLDTKTSARYVSRLIPRRVLQLRAGTPRDLPRVPPSLITTTTTSSTLSVPSRRVLCVCPGSIPQALRVYVPAVSLRPSSESYPAVRVYFPAVRVYVPAVRVYVPAVRVYAPTVELVSDDNDDGEDDVAHQVVYRQVLPCLVLLGVLLNSLCVLVLTRPRVLCWWCLTCWCVSSISPSSPPSTAAPSLLRRGLLLRPLRLDLVLLSQSVGTYTILWLALDRFMAVWTPLLYPRVQKKPNFTVGEDGGNGGGVHHDPPDIYIVRETIISTTTGLGQGFQHDYSEYWHKVYRNFYSLMVMCLPSCLMAVFNIGLVVGGWTAVSDCLLLLRRSEEDEGPWSPP